MKHSVDVSGNLIVLYCAYPRVLLLHYIKKLSVDIPLNLLVHSKTPLHYMVEGEEDILLPGDKLYSLGLNAGQFRLGVGVTDESKQSCKERFCTAYIILIDFLHHL